jgi:hypothetical protein
MEAPILLVPRVILKGLVQIPISLGRDARVLVNSSAEARRLAHLINPLKPSIDIEDVLKAVETKKLIPTLVINNSEPTESKTNGNKLLQRFKLPNSLHKPKEKNEMLFLETPDGEHKLTLSYKPPVEDSELGKLNIQFKGSEHTHLLDNCTEADFKGFIDFLVNHPNAQKIENSNQLTK